MTSQRQLEEANYVHRGDDGRYIEGLGQCSFAPCDHSKIIKDEVTGGEYRYCMKLQMIVDEFDSCKYHSEEQFMGLVGQMANLFKEENEAKISGNKNEAEKKNHWMSILIIICVGILIYMLMK